MSWIDFVNNTGGTSSAGHDFRHITPEILLYVYYSTKKRFRQYFFVNSQKNFQRVLKNIDNYTQKLNHTHNIRIVYHEIFVHKIAYFCLQFIYKKFWNIVYICLHDMV